MFNNINLVVFALFIAKTQFKQCKLYIAFKRFHS